MTRASNFRFSIQRYHVINHAVVFIIIFFIKLRFVHNIFIVVVNPFHFLFDSNDSVVSNVSLHSTFFFSTSMMKARLIV